MEIKDELILEAKSGDQNAMEQVFLRFKSVVRSIANSYFLMGGDREDLLQEGMFGLFKAVRDYQEGKNSFCTFAYICINRQIISAVKKYSGDKNKALQFYIPLENDLVAGISSNEDPLECTIAHEQREFLKQKISLKLSDFEQRVIHLFVTGYSYEEIAQNLNKSVKSVDGALQRARKKLC